jgi:rRNA maturation endonuclease Nob1
MIFVLDASAILNESNFAFEEGKRYLTTPLVAAEFRSMESRLLVENALKHGILSLRAPNKEFSEKAQALVERAGYKISRQDISIVALGLELLDEKEEFLVLTDDFSIQNFLALLKIPFSSATQGEIKEVFSFSKNCPVCGKKFGAQKRLKSCPDCGVPLKSRIKKKKIGD